MLTLQSLTLALIVHRYGPCDHRTDHGASDPLSASVKVTYKMISDLLRGFSDVSLGISKSRELGPRAEYSSTTSSEAGDLADLDIASGGEEVDMQKCEETDALAPLEEGSKCSETKSVFTRLVPIPLKTTAGLTTSLAKTVCPPEKITGNQGGLKVTDKASRSKIIAIPACVTYILQELGLGVHYGVSGHAAQPTRGCKEEEQEGLYKVFGKGLEEALIKPFASK